MVDVRKNPLVSFTNDLEAFPKELRSCTWTSNWHDGVSGFNWIHFFPKLFILHAEKCPATDIHKIMINLLQIWRKNESMSAHVHRKNPIKTW